MSRWTPGPWISSYDNEVGPDDGGFYEFNTVYAGHYDEIGRIYDTANAHLIAAAPDLYEALEMLLSSAHDHQTGITEALAALAKARGEA